MNSGEERRTSPSDYAELVSGSDKGAALIVGGQAVNCWALYFSEEVPTLADHAPFTSHDCDVVADQDWLLKTASKSKLKHKFYKAGISSSEIGDIVVPHESGDTVLQVLREIRGVTRAELDESALFIELDGTPYRVAHPLTLLKAKLANAVQLDQNGRQDVKHVAILSLCVRAFLIEHLAELSADHLTPRECLGLFNLAATIISSEHAHQFHATYGLGFANVIPVDEIPETAGPVFNFAQKFYPRLNVPS